MSEETVQTKRLPKWTVLANLKRKEGTPWIGRSIEFFDDETAAAMCYQRHSLAGDVPTMRPFHYSDEQHIHNIDTRQVTE